MVSWRLSVGLVVGLVGCGLVRAQTVAVDDAAQPTTTITMSSTLVLLPTLVKEKKSGALVYSMTAKDFHLTDDGVEQPVMLEDDRGGQPLALVVLIDTGNDGADRLEQYTTVPTMGENLVGDVPHKVAVVSFDSSPVVQQEFTAEMGPVYDAIGHLQAGDKYHNATLDALKFSVDMLRKQPTTYRRAILYIGETLDHGSSTTLEEAVRAVSDTNTAIYAVAFNSTRAATKKQAAKTFGEGPIPVLSSQKPIGPGPKKGCFSRDPNDPKVDLDESRAAQTYDCIAELLPPLAIARALFIAAVGAMEKNVPETVARLTGGEYFSFHSPRNLERDLATLANHVPNRYVLSFHPEAPHAGLHSLQLTLPDYPQLSVTARESYWADEAGAAQ